MEIYAIKVMYRDQDPGISKECYASIEEAESFIMGRFGSPVKVDNMLYRVDKAGISYMIIPLTLVDRSNRLLNITERE